MLNVQNLSVDLGAKRILDDLSFSLKPSTLTALIGPNGSGKTTLLRAVCGAVKRASGSIRIENKELDEYSTKELAKRVAVLRQELPLGFEFSVEELVLMGRHPYKSVFSSDTDEDFAILEEVLRSTDTEGLRARRFDTLSGGEKQRVLLARCLAQKPRLLLLDEPTNHLDVQHQLDLLKRVSELGITVLAALHDLNLALQFAPQGLLLKGGALKAAGATREILEKDRIFDVFGVDAETVALSSGRTFLAFQIASRP